MTTPPRKYMVEARVCGTCIHYHQHYVRVGEGSYQPLWYGHCGVPRRRHPTPEDGYPHWAEREPEPVSRS